MDNSDFGTRNARGDFVPHGPLRHAPLFAFPPNPRALLAWLPRYFLPWNLAWSATALAWWIWIVPDAQVLRSLAWDWVLWLLLPVLHEAHFFCIHRLIHTPFLYRRVPAVHHASVNPSPWSSLAMHPVEHLLYFATAAWHFLRPSHPLLAIYQLHAAGFGAVVGHVGFDKVELTETCAIDTHAYAHYLHHKYFQVNFGDGLIPLDRWFGTWHDGTAAGEARLKDRLQRRARARARATTGR